MKVHGTALILFPLLCSLTLPFSTSAPLVMLFLSFMLFILLFYLLTPYPH